ncbi:unnamed protein product [Staurois parvus]|uniref:Uncharacterized protein n=1 Tax=Staurois parvus TaxID=386267 RepID=A0ABN9FNP9_9NEOB|nr:unnamed protein product [Staurois parvus]
METHSMKITTHCCCVNLKATCSLARSTRYSTISRGFIRIDYPTLQHVLTPLCYFTWSTTLWLSCCCSKVLPLCYNTTNS